MTILRRTKRQLARSWKRAKPSFKKVTPWLLAITIIVVAITISIRANLFAEWTGINQHEVTTIQTNTSITTQITQKTKTLWDFMDLLVIPLFLVGIAVWFEKRNRDSEMATTEERIREDALQAYFDRMSDLLLDHNLYNAGKNDNVRYIARARTTSILEQLDGHRKGKVLSFLYSLNLIHCTFNDDWKVDKFPVIGLIGADLSEVSVPGGAVTTANLENTFLQNCDLSRAELQGVNLSKSVLTSALLIEANLKDTNLRGANLEIAFLIDTNLDGADLSNDNLNKAIVATEQLKKAKALNGCMMPIGKTYDSQLPLDRQCLTFMKGKVT